MQYGNAPESLGVVDIDFHEYMHYMYLPIKIHGEWSLPDNLCFATTQIQMAVAEEESRGNQWDYVYVTARRGYATPGNPLNRPGWHADGFGTDDINYVWTDRYPTLFAVGRFEGISEDHVQSTAQFEEQIASRRDIATITYQDMELLRLDSSVVHAAPEIPAPGGERSFFKVSFSNDKYNLIGNAHNYGLDYEWDMFERELVRNDPSTAGKDSR